MTQAHNDLQSEPHSQNISNISDITSTPLGQAFPILYLDPLEPSDPTLTEHLETTNTITQFPNISDDTSPKTSETEKSHSKPPPSSKKYDISKDPELFTSSIYPPIVSSEKTLSTQLDDHTIPLVSYDQLKSQLV